MLRPTIIITKRDNKSYQICVRGRYGGGYTTYADKDKAICMLARDGRTYDCGKEPILIIAPAEIKVAAGL